MSSEDPYFQFPIFMMLSAEDTKQLIQDVVTLSVYNYGQSLTSDARIQLAKQYAANHSDQKVPRTADCTTIAAGALRLQVNVRDVERECTRAIRLQRDYPTRGLQCRIRNDIAWSAHDADWPILKFKTLCGVYAGIGNATAQKMNHRLLRAFCKGYCSPKGIPEKQLMPTSTLRYWLEQLWFKNLFQFCKHGHERWYSNKFASDEELAKYVKALKTAKPVKKVVSTDDV